MIHGRYDLMFGLILAGSAATACRTGAGDAATTKAVVGDAAPAQALNAGDVSYLFPKDPQTLLPYPDLRADQTASTPPLLSPAIFAQIESFALNDVAFTAPVAADGTPAEFFPSSEEGPVVIHLPKDHIDPAKWHVHGFRVDDCAPPIGDTRTLAEIRKAHACVSQVRLVLHPVLDVQGDFSNGEDEMGGAGEFFFGFPKRSPDQKVITGDFAMHLIFDVAVGDFPAELLADLQRLKRLSPVPTNNRQLGVHPGLLAEHGAGPFGEAVRAFVGRWAAPAKLAKVAFLGVADARHGFSQDQAWLFFEGIMGANKTLELHSLANVGGGKFQAVSQFAKVSGSTLTPRNRYAVTSQSAAAPETGHPNPDRSARFAELLDTDAVQVNTVDCLSCHKLISGGPSGEGGPAAFMDLTEAANLDLVASALKAPLFPAAVAAFPMGSDPALRGAMQKDSYNLRNFGYHFSYPTVSVRAASESAKVAKALNDLSGAAPEPGACPDAKKQLAVVSCLGRTPLTATCLDLCAP